MEPQGAATKARAGNRRVGASKCLFGGTCAINLQRHTTTIFSAEENRLVLCIVERSVVRGYYFVLQVVPAIFRMTFYTWGRRGCTPGSYSAFFCEISSDLFERLAEVLCQTEPFILVRSSTLWYRPILSSMRLLGTGMNSPRAIK